MHPRLHPSHLLFRPPRRPRGAAEEQTALQQGAATSLSLKTLPRTHDQRRWLLSRQIDALETADGV